MPVTYYAQATIPECQTAFQIVSLDDLPRTRTGFRPSLSARLGAQSVLIGGLIGLGLDVLDSWNRVPVARLWVYCGKQLWLPISGRLVPAELWPDAATMWLIMPTESRIFSACVDALIPLLRELYAPGGLNTAASYQQAIRYICDCADGTAFGSGAAAETARLLLSAQQGGLHGPLLTYMQSQYALPQLLTGVPAPQRFPVLRQIAVAMGMNLDAMAAGGQSAAFKARRLQSNSRRINVRSQAADQAVDQTDAQGTVRT